MNINHIKLNVSLLTDLYTNTLIEAKDTVESQLSKKKLESSWKYVGENEKNILMLVSYPEQDELSNEQFSFLKSLFCNGNEPIFGPRMRVEYVQFVELILQMSSKQNFVGVSFVCGDT